VRPTITNSIGMKLALVPAGTFTMGSPADEPGRADDEAAHPVEITRPFHMGVYHVTQEEYTKVVGKNPSWFTRSGSARMKVRDVETGRFPVDNVSWRDATQFCARLTDLDAKAGERRTYRLPTEAEWEYACRAGTTTPFWSGAALGADRANFDAAFPYGGAARGVSLARPCPVGSYPPNKLGLYDLHGNIWHWCQDWYDRGYYGRGPAKDPAGPDRGTSRVIRGGSWCVGGRECRAAYRGNEAPNFQDGTIGFRVVCAAD
jgi:formylglycine-generating enzyme required for sulfatase activity